MSEQKILVFQVADPRDWIKLYVNEYHTPATYKKMNDTYLYYCFTCGGQHLFFCLSEEPLNLRVPRDTLERMNAVETLPWGEMTFEDWYLEMMAVTATGYKEE